MSEAKTVPADESRGKSIADLFEQLASSKGGLSREDAQDRLSRYGYNELEEEKRNPLKKFLGYFWGPIPWMIEVAAFLTAMLRHWADFFIISALLLVNGVVEFWQEYKADNVIELLKNRLALRARVLRNRQWEEIEARELVPGDVIHIRGGQIVPADVKLTSGNYLQVDESALTGESLPVEKSVSDIAYSGSIVRQGEMDALVVATGPNSYFGKTARLAVEAKKESHFQKAILKIGDYLIVLTLALVIIVFLVGLFRRESVFDILQFSLVLTVAAIPVALPAVLSVTLAVGATALARKEAIVSKLSAIEEMAGMDILCSDKTGTITENKLNVGDIISFGSFTRDQILATAALASREEDADPIDDAILACAKDNPLAQKEIRSNALKIFTPFDPVIKRTEAVVQGADGSLFTVSKGAPQVILSLVKDSSSRSVEAEVRKLALKGSRALGVAKTNAHGIWEYAGIIGLFDPPRPDSAATIKRAEQMGVQVKMITGDHIDIAIETAKRIHIGTRILPASSILEKQDRQARTLVEQADGFAQVFPEHKYHIVELLQENDHIVGMTGDGVNDAPALSKADIGIAVAGATDAAKSAADIVLVSPGISVIIAAIRESRKIFKRMSSYAIYRVSETIRVLFFVVSVILIFGFYPVNAMMIVLLALFTDIPIITIAYDRSQVSPQPERWNMRVLLMLATFIGLVGVFFSFGLIYIGIEHFHLSHEALQSYIFLNLVIAATLTIFLARTTRAFWTTRPGSALITATVTSDFLVTLFAVSGWLIPAIGWRLALFVWAYDLIAFLVTDIIKVRLYQLLDHERLKFRRR